MAKRVPMMTSTVRRCEPRAGFTLLELVIVLLISAMIIGGAAGLLVLSSEEFALKKATRELEAMAKRARATAVLKQTPYALVFSQGVVKLMPWSEAADEGALQAEIQGFGADEQAVASQPVYWELTLDNGMRADLRRWNAETWQSISGDAREIWRFDPSGLCEPIGVTLRLDDSSAGMEFNPLTAAITETNLNLQ